MSDACASPECASAPEKTVFYLIRHAEPDYGEGGRICLGRKLDLPLSAKGREQAALLGAQLKETHLDAIYVSPLLRAEQTADALPHNCPRISAPELTEVCSGEWDGMLFSNIRAQYPAYFDFTGPGGGMTPPGGESDEEALARVMSLLKRLSKSGGKQFALVTHAGLGRILLCHLMGISPHRKRAVPMKYASCTLFTFQNGIWKTALTGKMITDGGQEHAEKNIF